jgi:hypothetical protein
MVSAGRRGVQRGSLPLSAGFGHDRRQSRSGRRGVGGMSVRVDVQNETGQDWRWLALASWLLFAVLLACAFWLLLNACGLRLPGGAPLLTFCSAPAEATGPDPALAAEIARQRQLEGEIERLELALLRVPECAPPLPAPVPEPVAPPEPEAIPEDAWQERDISFLEGCWELDTDYQVQHAQTGEISRAESWQVCFDAAGAGRQTLVFDDGTQCTGPMLGSFAEQGRLQLQDDGNLRCDNDTYIYERLLTCERADPATAQCDSFQPETGGRDDVVFRHRTERRE